MSERIAFMTDIHGDAAALRDALAQAEALGCARVVCCGDLVDYGSAEDEVVSILRGRGIPCVAGNHDRWALRDPGIYARLSEDTFDFLRSLPKSWHGMSEGQRVAVHHASTTSDMDGLYPQTATMRDLVRHLDRAGAEVLVVGHTHVPMAIACDGSRLVANPGALLREVSRKREGAAVWDKKTQTFVTEPDVVPCPGTFGVLEMPSRRFTVHRAADGSAVDAVASRAGG